MYAVSADTDYQLLGQSEFDRTQLEATYKLATTYKQCKMHPPFCRQFQLCWTLRDGAVACPASCNECV